MNIKVAVFDAEEGGFWAEVPALPGCASQGGTMEEVVANVREAISGCFDKDGRPGRETGAAHHGDEQL